MLGYQVLLQRVSIIKKNKLTNTEQMKVLKLIADLLEEDFSFQDSIKFLIKLQTKPSKVDCLQRIQTKLAEGDSLHIAFADAGFSKKVISRIKLSEIHGDFAQTLKQISKQMAEEQERWRKLRQIMQYPVILCAMLILIIMTVKFVLFPKMQNLTISNSMVEHQHKFDITLIIIIMIFIISILGYYCCRLTLNKMTSKQRVDFYLKIPIIRSWCSYTYTSYFCLEMANLLKLGIEIQDILYHLQEPGNLFWIQDVANHLQTCLEQGRSLSSGLKEIPCFLESLSWIVYENEKKGRLSSELAFYGQEIWRDWLEKLESLIQYVQPVIFIGIGLFIVYIYASILLPLYQF